MKPNELKELREEEKVEPVPGPLSFASCEIWNKFRGGHIIVTWKTGITVHYEASPRKKTKTKITKKTKKNKEFE